MAAKDLDIKIEQGKNFKLTVTVREYSVVRNLTGFEGRMMIKSGIGGTTYASLTSAEITIPTPVNGQVVLNIPATTTAGYTWSQGIYDLEVFNSGTLEVIGVLKGFASVDQEVTV